MKKISFEILLKYVILRVLRIRMFLGLPDPDPLVRGTNPVLDPDPSIIKQKKVRKTLIPTVLGLLFDFYTKKSLGKKNL
jgi:hypothetical protein